MVLFHVWLGLVVAYLFSFLSERKRHISNYKLLTSRGAVEKSTRLMKNYYLLPWIMFLAAATEFFLRGGSLSVLHEPKSMTAIVSMGLILFGFALRMWVLSTLGWLWTRRILSCTGFPKVEKGPYRLISHPEYIARLIEGTGYCLFLGSVFTGFGFLVTATLFYGLMVPKESAHLKSYQYENA